jgi:phospholipase/carboxylesterase
MQLDPVRIREARDAFDKTIEDVVRREGFDAKTCSIALVGVSQGAIVALDAVASGRWKVGALVAFSGLLPPTTISRSGNQTPVLLIHGADDRTIPSMASTVAGGQLKAAGFQVEVDIEPRVGHTISLSGANKALQFLRRTLLKSIVLTSPSSSNSVGRNTEGRFQSQIVCLDRRLLVCAVELC